MAQMIRAGLYLESADGFGVWRVYLSADAQRYLRKVRSDGAMFDIVMKKIKWVVTQLFVTTILTRS